MFNNSSLVENEHEIPFYKHPAIEFTIYFVKITVLCLGILANLGVVLTVIFHSCPRKHAAFAAASLCASNIFYGLFILFYATPLRFSRTFQGMMMTSRLYCHVTQIGSNVPKTWIVAHHVWIAVDTFWLIKKPFQYTTLVAKYFKAAFGFIWIGLTVCDVIFQTVTMCFYESFFHDVYNYKNPPTSITPEIINIIINFALYISAFIVVVFLYFYVFQEALKRARGIKITSSVSAPAPKLERESLTGNTDTENEQEAYKKELRLLYGFVALITGTIFFIIARNFYYGFCLYIGCQKNRARNDFLVSITTSIMLSLLILFAPYTYFYRNPLFWKCFLKFVNKACPRLARYSAQLRQQTNGYTSSVRATRNASARTTNNDLCNNAKAVERNNGKDNPDKIEEHIEMKETSA